MEDESSILSPSANVQETAYNFSMSKKHIKQKIQKTVEELDQIVLQGGKVRQDDPLMIRLVKLRRELIKTTIKSGN